MDPILFAAGVAIFIALVFDFINGFHDTANAVTTVIYSKAMKAERAILMSAILNFIGAVTVGTTVALFVVDIVSIEHCSLQLIYAVLFAGVIWNLATWYLGLPVSSSHCLIGSLVGGGFAAGGLEGIHLHKLYEALFALLVSPLVGFVVALLLALLLKRLLGSDEEQRGPKAKRLLPWIQIASSGAVSYSHGANDGQKTMGIITLILATQFSKYGFTLDHVPFLVVVGAALAIGLGTRVGGWRVIKTVGERLSMKKIDPLHGCIAETTTAVTVLAATCASVPVSTTHVLTSSVIGGTRGLHGPGQTDPSTMKKIVYAWVLTLPVTAVLAAVLYKVLHAIF